MKGSILNRIASGDEAAVQECLNAYGGLVWSLVRRLSPNPAEAEDAVQEIFIDLWKAAPRFDGALSSETVFVAMVARRRLIDRLRRRERQPGFDPLSETLTDERRRPPDQEAEICAEASVAASALKRLKPEQQQVLRLAIYQGLTHQEIARATGLPLGTVKTHVRRGLQNVREALGVRIFDATQEAP